MNLLVKIVFSFIQINIKGTVPDSSKHTITMYTFGANQRLKLNSEVILHTKLIYFVVYKTTSVTCITGSYK